MFSGTHDVSAVSKSEAGPNGLRVMTSYFDNASRTAGVLLSLIYITSNGSLDFDRSRLLVSDRASSTNHTISNLYPGHYRLLVYDVESNFRVSSGLGLPAVSIVTRCSSQEIMKIQSSTHLVCIILWYYCLLAGPV